MAALNQFPKRIRWIFSILFLLLALMLIYRLFFFFQYRPAEKPFSGKTFLLGLRYDARVAAILGLIILVLSSIKKLNPFYNQRCIVFWNIFLAVCFAVILIVYSTDFYYYDYLKQRLNASVINFLADTAISLKMVWQTYPVLIMMSAFVLSVYLFIKWHSLLVKRIQRKNIKLNFKYPALASFFAFLLFSILIFGKLNQYPLRWSDAFSLGDDFKAQAALNPFQSFFSSLRFKNSGYDIKKVRDGYSMISAYFNIPGPDNINLNYERNINFSDTLVNKPNIILVICESFSSYKSSMFGNKLDPTPYFNSLSNNGIFFERCFTPAFGTARGVWATITGIPDVESPKTASRNPAAVDQHTIMNDFRMHSKFYFLGGSTTWANIRGVLNNNISGLRIYEEEHFKAKKVDVWGISDKNLFLEANNILAQEKTPFFAVIQTADNHRPYTIPAEDRNSFKKLSFPKDTLKKYGFESNEEFNSFRYTDFCFETFISAAQKEKYFSNTIFVFVGDHGLRGDAGEMFPLSFTKQGIAAEHVPLLFYSPGYLKPVKIRQVCSQLDVLPSLASLARQPYRNNTMGVDLFDSSFKNRFAFIADPDLHTVGLVGDEYYYGMNRNTGKEDFVSVINDDIPAGKYADSMRRYMKQLSAAWYETSKYLLFNNRKK